MKKIFFPLALLLVASVLWATPGRDMDFSVSDSAAVEAGSPIGAPIGVLAQNNGPPPEKPKAAMPQLPENLKSDSLAKWLDESLKVLSAKIDYVDARVSYYHQESQPDVVIKGFIPARDLSNPKSDEVIIIGYNGDVVEDLVIPTRIDYPEMPNIQGVVVGIGPGALSNHGLRGNITFESKDTVRFIGAEAFANNMLDSVEIPPSVTLIGNSAFANNHLTTVTIPSTITTIEYSTFASNLLGRNGQTVVIPESITEIGHHAFTNNELTSMVIPYNVKTIANSAFEKNKIATLTFKKDSMGRYGITDIGDAAFSVNYLTTFDVPDTLTTLNYGVFSHNHLTKVTIPETITDIGDSAFSDNWLPNVTIPKSVKRIGKGAFSVNYLTEVLFAGNPDVNYPTSQGRMEGSALDIIDDGAFSINDLSEVSIPNSVRRIGDRAFYDNLLTRVVLGSNLQQIGHYAFLLNKLTSVTIPDKVTFIGAGAFIGNFPPEYRNASKSTRTRVAKEAHEKKLGQIHYDKDNKKVDNVNELKNVTLGLSVRDIQDHAFAYNKLENVVIPNTVTNIGHGAFAYNEINGLTLPSTSVLSIGIEAFKRNHIKSLVLPDKIKGLGDGAFKLNELERPVIIPRSISSRNPADINQHRAAFDQETSKFYIIEL